MSGYRHLDDPNFDVDPMNGVRQRLVIDGDGIMHFETTQDDSQLRDFAHEKRSNYSKNERLGDVVHAASIPVLVQYDLIKRGIWGDKVLFKKWLNSIEAAPYRTREFRF